MRKNLLIIIAAGVALAAADAPAAMAQDVLGTGLSPASTLPVTEVTEATDGTRNFKSFTVEAPGALSRLPRPGGFNNPARDIRCVY